MESIKKVLLALIGVMLVFIMLAIIFNMCEIMLDAWVAISNGEFLSDHKTTNLLLAGVIITIASTAKKD